MENQQTIKYIRTHLAGGHSEATIRQHFLAHGWTQAALDDVFTQYRQTLVPEPPVAKRPQQRFRWLKANRLKLAITAGVALILAIGLYVLNAAKTPEITPPPVKKLSDTAKRVNDVNIVAGAISQYTRADGGILPTTTAVGSDGSLEVCNTVCDSATSIVAPLQAYKATDVKFATYAPTLVVSDLQMMYLVPGASCNGKSGIGAPNPSPRSMVILYAVAADTGLLQRCVAL